MFYSVRAKTILYLVLSASFNQPTSTSITQGPDKHFIRQEYKFKWASLVAQMVKNVSVMQDTLVRSLGQEYTLEKEMATYSGILAWRIPWTERNLVGYSPWGHKESAVTERLLSLSKA